MKRNVVFLGRVIVFCLSVALLLSLLTGCKGDTGAQGAAGQNGTDLTTTAKTETCTLCHQSGSTVADPANIHPGLTPPADFIATIDAVSTNVVGTGTELIIDFTVTDTTGNAIPGFADADSGSASRPGHLRFNIVKLVAGTSGDTNTWWPVGSTERTFNNLVDNGGGSYTYTTAAIVNTGSTVTANFYDNTKRTRVGLVIFPHEGTGTGVLTALGMGKVVTYDIVNGQAGTTKDVVTMSGCLECHGRFGDTFHAGEGRVDHCEVCHYEGRGGGAAEYATMVHKIHSAKPDWGIGDFSHLGYPQDLKNCRKCHTGADGDNWLNIPTQNACATCHDIVFTAGTGTLHSGGAQTDNSGCAGCHPGDYTAIATNHAPIGTAHLTDNATPNNPNVPAGATNFNYVISGVTVTNNQPVVTFRILSGPSITSISTPVTLVCNTSSSTSTDSLLTGFSGSPSFLVAYALPQDGVSAPADYNNLGKAAGQPASVSIANVCAGTQGSMSGPDASGYYTATLWGSNNAAVFPAGATLRAVALQGYFSQNLNGTSSTSDDLPRHTISVMKAVTGDTARRSVVDDAKCFNCHEWFEGHGGNRVYTNDVCVMCHVPNLSSSGRGGNVANLDATNAAALAADGYDPANPSTWPEATNNMKDMIHGIHAAHKRTTPYQFVRDAGTRGVLYYNWSHVGFPGVLDNCLTCHKPGTYAIGTNAVLPTTDVTTDGLVSTPVSSDRASLPNNADLITSPSTATCIACHDADLPVFHMQQNGGSISVPRSTGQ